MINFLENVGLEVFLEDDNLNNLICYATEKGTVIKGYNNYEYINCHIGDVQLIATVKTDTEPAELVDFNVHAAGRSVWNVKVNSMNIDTDNKGVKRIAVTNEQGRGLAVVNVVNSAVLPSYAEDEIIQLQMIAFPIEINYYKDRDAYSDSSECVTKNGKIFALSEGTLFPAGLLSQSNVETDKEKQELCNYMRIHGRVKHLFLGTVTLGEKSSHPYVNCVIDTEFGELEILHTINMVDEDMRQYMKVGASVSVICYLSADAAINDYDKGYVCDAQNNLKLLRYAFEKDHADFLNDILAQDAHYYSQTSNKKITEKEKIIEWLQYVYEQRDKPCKAYYAKITGTKNSVSLEYSIDTQCLALAYDDDGFDSLVFMDLDDENKISRIFISNETRYIFSVDMPENENFEFDGQPPELIDAILIRANLLVLKNHLERKELNQIINDNKKLFEKNIYDMTKKLNCDMDEIASKNDMLQNIFAYFFAMSTIHKNKRWKFNTDDCLSACTPKNTPFDKTEKYQRAFDNGKIFYNDFINSKESKPDLFEALLAVQAIAQQFD